MRAGQSDDLRLFLVSLKTAHNIYALWTGSRPVSPNKQRFFIRKRQTVVMACVDKFIHDDTRSLEFALYDICGCYNIMQDPFVW